MNIFKDAQDPYYYNNTTDNKAHMGKFTVRFK